VNFNSLLTKGSHLYLICSECVIKTLEGIGISTSQCPTCKQPGWKKDLKPNHQINNAVDILRGMDKNVKLARSSAAAARVAPKNQLPASNHASPLHSSLEEEEEEEAAAQDQDEEMAAQRDLPSTDPILEELDFGPLWHAALQNQAPPRTLEELKNLQDEIELLESALQLCQTMPCAQETVDKDDSQDVENRRQQQPTSSTGAVEVSALGGKASAAVAMAAPGRKQARKLSELASQHNLTSAHSTEDDAVPSQQVRVILSTGDEVAATAQVENDRATTALSHKNRSPPNEDGAGEPSPKRARIEPHHTIAAALVGVVPDSQPSIEYEATRGENLHRGNNNSNLYIFNNNKDEFGGASSGPVLLGTSAVLNTQSAAELLNGLGCGFIAASQLPLDNSHDGGDDGKESKHACTSAAAGVDNKSQIEELAEPFGLAFPAPAPSRSGLQSAFYSGGPSNNYISNINNGGNHHRHSGNSKPLVPSRTNIPTTSQSGKNNTSNTTNGGAKTDIRTLLLSQKAANEAADAAAPSQAPICMAFASTDQQLKGKVQAVQRKIPTLRYMHSVSEATTHVIVATDDSLIADKRSRLYLEGLARGCWVVSTAWLDSCFDTGMRVKEKIYEVKGCRVIPSRFYKDDWLVANVLGGPQRCRLLANQGKKLFSAVSSIRVERFEEKGKNAGKLRDIVMCLLRFAGAKVTENGACGQDSIVVTNDKSVAAGFHMKNYKRVLDARWVLDSVSCCQLLPESWYLFEREVE
jgi:BRCA1 C Terminus (BRCT) domain